MTDSNASTEAAVTAEFVREQIARNKKAERKTWIVGGILVLLIGGYFSFATYMFREIMQPAMAARMIGQAVEDNLPLLLDETENAIMDKAPVLFDYCKNTVLETMPRLRQMAQDQIDVTYEELLPLLREEIRSTIRVFMELHADEIKTLFAEQKNPEFIESFVDELTEELSTSLDNELKYTFEGVDLKYFREASLEMLYDLNSELNRLAGLKAEEMTQSERLQRRLIVSWLHVLDQFALCNARGDDMPELE